jgi:hypothetical protein
MWRESDEITKFLSRVVILAGNSRTRADSFARGSIDNVQRFTFAGAARGAFRGDPVAGIRAGERKTR